MDILEGLDRVVGLGLQRSFIGGEDKLICCLHKECPVLVAQF